MAAVPHRAEHLRARADDAVAEPVDEHRLGAKPGVRPLLNSHD